MNQYGFARVTCVSIRTAVADPSANAGEIVRMLGTCPDSDVVVFPELCVTGYTCADLFGQARLLDGARAAIGRIAAATAGRRQLVVVGAPIPVGNSLFNCGVAIADGDVLGVVPKQFLPNYKEFYESRWFSPAVGKEPAEIELGGRRVPFGIDLLFEAPGRRTARAGRAGWSWASRSARTSGSRCPPAAMQAMAGATVLVNLSASNETIGKSRYRTDLVVGQSGRCVAAYAMAGCGPTESTTDVVFGGHCLIAENGALLAESPRVGDGQPIRRDSYAITRDVDVARLRTDRRVMTSFDDSLSSLRPFRRVPFAVASGMEGLHRDVAGTPFVPGGPELHRRCAEIFGIQCAGLAKRIEQLPTGTPLNIGISGGLDSTLSLLVAVTTCDMLGLDRRQVHGLTMPGFGTTQRTRTNALDLMAHLGVSSETIDISALALEAFREMDHAPFGIDVRGMDVEAFRAALARVPAESLCDLTFENVQARLRTFLLMSKGFVVGTGDLSELALGWCTYNGDHMSMYNPNCSIPKTLVQFLVRYVAMNQFPDGPVRRTLLSIVETTISPELLPASLAGEIEQSTEATLGPYELHDFILYNAVRCGHSPAKILFLSEHAAFTREYPRELIERTMRTFYTRFFQNQFKRSCVPDGPKVGTVSLSPRGDWRMPSDADPSEWLKWGGE